jgi:hypothetical protein
MLTHVLSVWMRAPLLALVRMGVQREESEMGKRKTYYVVHAFPKNGRAVADQPREVPTEAAARLSLTYESVKASAWHSREPATGIGEYDDALIIASVGDVPGSERICRGLAIGTSLEMRRTTP